MIQTLYRFSICLTFSIITTRAEATQNVINSNTDSHRSLQESDPFTNNFIDEMEDIKRAWKDLPRSGWGKRSWQDLPSSGWGKRGWQDLQTSGWGKRGWQDLQTSGWGKRAERNLQSSEWGKRAWKSMPSSGWGKRSRSTIQNLWGRKDHVALRNNEDYADADDLDDTIGGTNRAWNSLRSPWGKRDGSDWGSMKGAWGKRDPAWHNLKGLWGKRSLLTDNFDYFNNQDLQDSRNFLKHKQNED